MNDVERSGRPWLLPPRPLPRYGAIAVSGLVLAAVAVGLYVLAAVRGLVFVMVFAVVLAFVLHHPIAFFGRFMPRPLAVILTVLLTLGLLGGVGLLVIPPLEQQAQRLLEELPRAVDRLQGWLRRNGGRHDLIAATRSKMTDQLGTLLSQAVPIALGVASVLATALAVLVLAFFLAAAPRVYVNGLVRLVPRRHVKPTVILLKRIGVTLRSWTLGTLVSMAIIGVLTGLGLMLVGVDTWLVLGVLAFFGEFVPFLGPILTAIPGLAVGFSLSPTMGMWVLGVYLAVQQLENHLVQPFVMKRAVRIQPAVLLLWQLALGVAFGLPALLVATPLLAVVQVTVQYLYIERALGKAPDPEAGGKIM